MTALYLLDIPENVGFIEVASRDPGLSVTRLGEYFEISSNDCIVIDRRATGCRHAVWYSSVAGVADGRIVQHDKDALRVVPNNADS